ncbi:stage II sporolation protein M [Gottschalkia acidurici 9a]|uniref:Stage II sporolation protein M n=1 Tax=Gottschalkia acidurici (strain ATCC 7906 / DSM 604 / BCRC 14475 / CIP 104303 / KCTC 5404 / NCIMB 10678 / 9a) TaxID=1128398 RepID=K0AX99_GOTA9|nr:stage II sporulation protein M [Gottschalkia acidurici]AFS78413.1 stage II sporolation protein M [Gottschalkia acidurici 9a]
MKLLHNFKKHVKDNVLLYFALIIVFMIGISSGAITINMLKGTQKEELIKFLDSFFKVINENDVDNILLVKQSFKNNLQTLIMIWFLGITVIGIPLVAGVVLLRGFVVGFTVGFLVKELGLKGFLFSILSILPQNIFLIPWIIASSVVSIGFSIKIIKSRTNKSNKFVFLNELTRYSIVIGILFLISIIGILIESYATPMFMKLIS